MVLSGHTNAIDLSFLSIYEPELLENHLELYYSNQTVYLDVGFAVSGKANYAVYQVTGQEVLRGQLSGLNNSQIVHGIDFFERISAIVDSWAEERSQ